MEQEQLIAVVVIIVVMGGAGAFILLSPPTDNHNNTLPENEVPTDSYIIATGTFDYIDVYTIDTYDGGGYVMKLQAHIINSAYTYGLPRVSTDYPDYNYVHNSLYRIQLWICIDKNLTMYWFPMSDSIVYNLMFQNIDIEIYITPMSFW